MQARLLIVRLGSLGDLIHTLPAVGAIRRLHPDAEIDWLVDARHRELIDLVPVVSRVVPLEHPTPGGWLDVRARLRARDYAVALDFQGLIKSAALAWLSGAHRTVGFARAALREPMAAAFYTEQVPVDDTRHVIEKNLHLAAAVGADTARIDFPIASVTSPVADALVTRMGGPFALLNCGAAWPNKRWPPDRFGRIAAWLHQTHGLTSIALWGPGEEDLAAEVARASGGAAVAAPPTSLTDLVALARAARLMVSGDTGPTHVAAAVGTPLVALFGPTSSTRNGPWAPGDVEVTRHETCSCRYERRCRLTVSEWCLGTISEADVRAAISRRLAS